MRQGDRPASRTRVLIVSAMYPTPDDFVRGVAVQREVAALRARGCDVEVVGKSPGWGGYGIQAWRAWRALLADFDIVHAHFGTSGFIAALVRLGRRRTRAPLIVTLHGSDVAMGPRPRLSRYWLQYWLSLIACLAARRVIVQDEAMMSTLPLRIRRRTELLGQGVDPNRFAPGSERERRLILFLSDRNRPVKRFALAQAAVARAATSGLRLDSLDSYRPGDIPAAMSRATVGLLTSEREGMPVAVKEALAAGLPVLAVDLPPLRRLAESFPGLVTIAAADAEALGRALDALLRAPEPTAYDRATAVATLRALGWAEPARTDRLIRLYERELHC